MPNDGVSYADSDVPATANVAVQPAPDWSGAHLTQAQVRIVATGIPRPSSTPFPLPGR